MERTCQRKSNKTVKIQAPFTKDLQKHSASWLLDATCAGEKYLSQSHEIITMTGNHHVQGKTNPRSRDTGSNDSQPEDTSCNGRLLKDHPKDTRVKKLRVSFIDQVTSAPIADIIEVDSYAKYNVLEVERRNPNEKVIYCACVIFWFW